MTSSPHGPYAQGYTRATMVDTEGGQTARWSQSHKVYPSWDRSLQLDSVNLESLVIVDQSLQLDSVNLESLVIVDQHATVNTFPGLVHTARHTTKVCCTRSRRANPQGRQSPKVWPVIGVKS